MFNVHGQVFSKNVDLLGKSGIFELYPSSFHTRGYSHKYLRVVDRKETQLNPEVLHTEKKCGTKFEVAEKVSISVLFIL